MVDEGDPRIRFTVNKNRIRNRENVRSSKTGAMDEKRSFYNTKKFNKPCEKERTSNW